MAMESALEARETHSLIGSDKVEGTAVYRSNGDKVGTIERVMIDKISGKVAYRQKISFHPLQGMCAGLAALRPRPDLRARSRCNFSGSRERGASSTGSDGREAERWVSAPSARRPATILSEPSKVGRAPACCAPASCAPFT